MLCSISQVLNYSKQKTLFLAHLILYVIIFKGIYRLYKISAPYWAVATTFKYDSDRAADMYPIIVIISPGLGQTHVLLPSSFPCLPQQSPVSSMLKFRTSPFCKMVIAYLFLKHDENDFYQFTSPVFKFGTFKLLSSTLYWNHGTIYQ